MKVDGRCHCGYLTYTAEVDPEKVEICHCTDCQTLSGSAFRVVVPAEPGTFRLLSGAPKTYIKTAESGNRRIQAFCPECGTSIYSTAAADRAQGRRDSAARLSAAEGPVLDALAPALGIRACRTPRHREGMSASRIAPAGCGAAIISRSEGEQP